MVRMSEEHLRSQSNCSALRSLKESCCRKAGAIVLSDDNLSVETLPKASYLNANVNLLSQKHRKHQILLRQRPWAKEHDLAFLIAFFQFRKQT